MYTIVLIEDEQSIRDMIKEYLERQFYQVYAYEDGELGMQAITDINPNLIILDVMLPKKSGFEICKEIRKLESYYPIIMLTARGQQSDVIVGLEIGADDYMVKPFSLEELEARIRAVLRRNKIQSDADNSVKRGAFVLDLAKYELYKGQKLIKLTPTEFQLFHLMFKNPGRVYTRLQLLELALGEEYLGYERSIDTHIRNLRQKIEEHPGEPEYIVTVHGIGYKYNEN
jgi:two-component system OmpR family response regulator